MIEILNNGILNNVLKNADILLIQSQEGRLKDIYEVLDGRCREILRVSHLKDVPARDFDMIFVEYAVSDMTSILTYKNLIEKSTPATPYGLTPTIFIADTKTYDHRLNAFEIGAADFIARPFQNKEIILKCHMHIQNRRRICQDDTILIGNLKLNPTTRIVTINEEPVTLTQLEYKILHFLLKSPRQVVTRTEIYENVWGPALSSTGRLDTQLYNLKKKLVNFNGKIKSVNKVGMRILVGDSTFSQGPKKAGLQSPSQEPHLS